jgi:hypothetical protein
MRNPFLPDRPQVLEEEYRTKKVTPGLRKGLKEIRKEASRKEWAIRTSQANPSERERHYPKVIIAPLKREE